MTMTKRRRFAEYDRPVIATKQEAPLKKILFVPDCHVPYHDPVAYACMIEAARMLQPHVLVLLGDFADFYCVGNYLKRKPSMRLRAEAQFAAGALRHLAETCGPQLERKVYVAGNHEDRFDRYITERAPELDGITGIPQLLDLDAGGFEYVPYGQSAKVGLLNITHDTGSAGPQAHVRAANDFQGSTVIGHTHIMGVSYMGCVGGAPRVAAMFGWLGSVELAASEYKHRARAEREWMHGFGTGAMTQDGVVYLQAHPIVSGRTVVNGEVIGA